MLKGKTKIRILANSRLTSAHSEPKVDERLRLFERCKIEKCQDRRIVKAPADPDMLPHYEFSEMVATLQDFGANEQHNAPHCDLKIDLIKKHENVEIQKTTIAQIASQRAEAVEEM